jgi:hypothetical protein
MTEGVTCPRCGYTGPPEARYCAHCGSASVSRGTRLISATDRMLARVSRRHIAWFGLAALFLVSMQAHHLILHPGLCSPVSYILLTLVFAVGGACLGWAWKMPSPGRSLFERTVMVFAGMAVSLVAVLQIDRLYLGMLGGSGRTTVFDIPGIHIEVLGTFSPARISSTVVNPPPYWLLAMMGALLVGVISNLLRTTRTGRQLT